MQPEKSYDELLNDYRNLQLRVTRFSSIEQELINTRDRLDHELVMYRRLNAFNTKALKENTLNDLIQLTVESIIDVFEIESAIVVFKSSAFHTNFIVSEGLQTGIERHEEYKSCLMNVAQIFQPNTSHILSSDLLNSKPQLNEFDSGLFYNFFDPSNDFSICITGFISKENEPLYNKISDRSKMIFSVFAQQTVALLYNLLSKHKVEEQIKIIEKSEIELKKLSLIATKTKSGVVISDNEGRIEWVNEAFESTTGYQLNEVIGRKPKDFLQAKDQNTEELLLLKHALREKNNVEVTVINYNKKGERYYNQLEVTPIFNEKGEHINFISLQRDITHEIKTQQEILRINNRFELISRKLNIGIWEWDITTNHVIWNDIIISQYGAERHQVEHKLFEFWQESIHPDDLPRVMQQTDQLLKGEVEIIENEYRIITLNKKEERVMRCLTTPEFDESGKMIRLLGSSFDVTDEKVAELKLKASEEKYRNIIENMNLGLVEVNNLGELQFANKKFYDLTNTTSAQALLFDSTPLKSIQKFKEKGYITSYLELDKNVFEIELQTPTNYTRNLLVSSVKTTNLLTQKTGFISIYLDVTSEKALQKNLENSLYERENLIERINSLKLFYESILNHSPAKIVVLDSNFNIKYTNQRLLDKEPIWANASDQSIYEFAKKSEYNQNYLGNLVKYIEKSVETKSLVKYEELLFDTDEPQYILRNILPYYNTNQELEHVIVTGVNITELKLSEESVLKKNEELKKINAELDNFVYSVSHDLRSPLLSIKGILSLVFNLGELTEETEEYLKMAETSVNRLDGTIQEILEYSRNARLDIKPEWVEIEPMVTNIFEDIRFSTNTTVQFETHFIGSTQILSDKARLNTVLKNLIGNAVKYKNNNISNPFVRFEFENTEHEIKINVIDNGEGISEEAQKRVFEMFYRGTKNSIGTGLGLYICKEIIDKLKGTISVQSKLNQGTTITIVLPKIEENE